MGSSVDWVPLLPVRPRLAHGRVSTCYPCVAMHSLATAMKRTERISSATAWRSVAMPAGNGLARACVATGLASALCSGASAFARWSALGTGGARPFGRVPSLRRVPCSSHTTAHVRVKVMRRASPCARLGVVGVGWGRWLGGTRQDGTTRLMVPRLLVGRPLASPHCSPRAVARPRLPITPSRPRAPVRCPDLEHAFAFIFYFSVRWGGVQRGGCPCPPVRAPVVSRGTDVPSCFSSERGGW